MFKFPLVLFVYILWLKFMITHSFSISNIISNVCKFTNIERCDDVWINNNLAELQWKFDTKLYGQPLASEIIIGALMGHFQSAQSSPLVLSFHGSSGVGKTYVVQFIVNSLYKKGLESKFVHSYVGSTDFPVVKNITDYKEKIEKTILSSVKNCPQSLFIFDEVHKLQKGILDTISSLIRCSKLNKDDLDLSKAIFILISNTGSNVIVDKALQLNKNGISRDQFKLNDFENDIIAAALNEGGLVESGLITYSFIDHYVPFFPLEERHIIQCIKDELKSLKMESLFTENLARDIIEDFTFMPEPDNLFSSNGCKRVPQKLSVRVFSNKLSGTSEHFGSHTEL